MKILIVLLILVCSNNVFSQEKNGSFCLNELKKIEKIQDKYFSVIDEKQNKISFFCKNGIFVEININKYEAEGIASNQLNFSYFISDKTQFFMKNNNDREIINFVEKEIEKYNLTMKNYILDALHNLKLGVDKNKSNSIVYPLYSITTDFESELVFNKFDLTEKKIIISVSYFIKL